MKQIPAPLEPAEIELLLNCARTDFNDAKGARNRELIAAGVAWNRVLAYAEAHSVASLLYASLRKTADLSVETWIWDRLLRILHRTEYQNRLYRVALQQVLDKLEAQGVPAMVLKGLSLVELIYGRLNLRPTIDINLLVRKNDFAHVRAMLLEEGFETAPWARSSLYQRLHSQCELIKRGRFRLVILLQNHPINRPTVNSLDVDRFWREAQEVELADRTVKIPSAVDSVLYLCQQPIKHGFTNTAAFNRESPDAFVFKEWTANRLIRFVDIAETIQYYGSEIDWDLLVRRARNEGLAESTHLSLAWTRRLLGVRIDDGVFRGLPEPQARFYRKVLFELIKRPGFWQRTWMRQPAWRQRALIRLVDFQEFVFPESGELARRNGLRSRLSITTGCTRHSVYWVLRGIVAVAGWVQRKFKRRVIRPVVYRLRRLLSRRRILSYIGIHRP